MIDHKYITTVQQYEDTEDFFVEIPDEICQELNWKEGDIIDWKTDDKGIILHKVQNTNSTQRKTINPYIIIKEEIDHYLKQTQYTK